uniref:Uncharacterized protein n=1 Tax=Anguilla anguilla TaxID=7936 RepID=A0A0E9VT98_ANGAN
MYIIKLTFCFHFCVLINDVAELHEVIELTLAGITELKHKVNYS